MFACLAGLNPNMNVNCMEVGGLSMKDSPQPQSRLSQWTHPNSMENLSGSSSPMEPGLSKHGTDLILLSISIDSDYTEYRFNSVCVCLFPSLFFSGAISAGPNLGAPGKPSLDDSYNPYNLMQGTDSPASPLVTPDSWGQSKNANDKMSNGTNISWPPGQ